MALKFEEPRVLQAAEAVADAVWKHIVQWDRFTRDVVGGQLARAADSVGANIAEAHGRFHFGEKLRFVYYARGSLFETKYWLNRAQARGLLPPAQAEDYAAQLTELARQINGFAANLRSQRQPASSQPKTLQEASADCSTDQPDNVALFSSEEFDWLRASPDS